MKRNKLFLKVYGQDKFISLDYITSITIISGNTIRVTENKDGYESDFALDSNFHHPDDIKEWMKHLTKEK